MESLCTYCLNQKGDNYYQDLKYSNQDEFCINCQKNQPTQQQKQKIDELLKICQKSISFIHNQSIYMKQFIDSQIRSLISLLEERQSILQKKLSEILQNKLNYYAECELRLSGIKKNNEYLKLKQFNQLELYNDDKILDFSNIKLLTEEIKLFGKKNNKKQNNTQQIITKKKDDKENNQLSQQNQYTNFQSFLPDLSQSTLIYKLGQKFQFPKQGKIFGYIQTTNSKFGWYYECINPTIGYNICNECYIYSLTNIQNIPPMKFYVKESQQKYSLFLDQSKIGFGKDCKDLLIDFDNLKNSNSTLGSSFDLYYELDGESVLAGKPNGWNIEIIEIFYIK